MLLLARIGGGGGSVVTFLVVLCGGRFWAVDELVGGDVENLFQMFCQHPALDSSSICHLLELIKAILKHFFFIFRVKQNISRALRQKKIE